ncbi:unnamed protein product [marine sediment metagenome]|uniref:Uncharacterized protein n=1 Tax=marine sediment metagenome TaxID=412755 RepID=X1TT72_9ZZZZ
MQSNRRRNKDRKQSKIVGQVEYIEDEKQWRLVELRIDGEYIYHE